jgi:serine/threonine protein phosphatase PrpC
MNPEFRIEDFSATHVGEVRSENEDSHAAVPEAKVWLVADGMGGHVNGKFASETIANAVARAEFPEEVEAACDVLAQAIHDANAEIFAKSVEAGAQMGSTFVGLVVRSNEFVVMWSGDSRAYVYRDGQLIQLTTDHTQVQAMIDRGLLTPEEALTHPMRHVLARAVGVEEVLQIDAVRDMVEPRDLFLLCSDGLYGQVSDDEIAAILRRSGATACGELIERCLASGAPDNVTVTLVSVHEPTLLVLSGEA